MDDTVSVKLFKNPAPTADDNIVTTTPGTPYTFKKGDFRFSDTDGGTLASVTIVTLPDPGTLALGGTAVTENQSVDADDIDDRKLVFTPAAGDGRPYTSFTFKVSDGSQESAVAYKMTVDVTSIPGPTACPADSDWPAEMTAGYDSTPILQSVFEETGYTASPSFGALAPAMFSRGGTPHTVTNVYQSKFSSLDGATVLTNSLSFAVTGGTLPDGTILTLNGTALTVGTDTATGTTGQEQWDLKTLGISLDWVEDQRVSVCLKFANTAPDVGRQDGDDGTGHALHLQGGRFPVQRRRGRRHACERDDRDAAGQGHARARRRGGDGEPVGGRRRHRQARLRAGDGPRAAT